MGWRDQGAQGDQKRYRDKLIRNGVDPRRASKIAKKRYPLPKDQAKSKNRQPHTGFGDGPKKPWWHW